MGMPPNLPFHVSLFSLMTMSCFISWTSLNSLYSIAVYYQTGCGQQTHACKLLINGVFFKGSFYFLMMCVCVCPVPGAHGRQKTLLGLGPLELE